MKKLALMSKKGKIILSVVSGILFTAISFYISLPPINPMAPEFWKYLVLVVLSFAYPFVFTSADGAASPKKSKSGRKPFGIELVKQTCVLKHIRTTFLYLLYYTA